MWCSVWLVVMDSVLLYWIDVWYNGGISMAVRLRPIAGNRGCTLKSEKQKCTTLKKKIVRVKKIWEREL